MGGGIAPTEWTYEPPIYATESYEIVKSKLNVRAFGCLGGVYWPHTYMHPRVRGEIAHSHYLKLFIDEIPIIPATLPYGTLNGEMIDFVIQSKHGDFRYDPIGSDYGDSAFGVWPPYPFPGGGIGPYTSDLGGVPHTFRDGTSNIISYMIFASHFGPRWSRDITRFNPTGIPQVFSTAAWYAGNLDYTRDLDRVANMNVIKTSYYAENCATPDITTADLNFGNFIKLVYNTNDPSDAMDPRQLAIINSVGTTSNGATQVRIHYRRFYEEPSVFPIQKRELIRHFGGFGLSAPTLRAYEGIIDSEMRNLCSRIKLLQSRKNRLFLRNSQPNTLIPKDLGRLTSYVEYNSKILSMLETVSLVGGRSRTTSVYDPPSSPTGGSY